MDWHCFYVHLDPDINSDPDPSPEVVKVRKCQILIVPLGLVKRLKVSTTNLIISQYSFAKITRIFI